MILLQAGTPHNLTCRAFNAKPAATIIWFRDGTQQEGAVASTVRLGLLPLPFSGPACPHLSFSRCPPMDTDARKGCGMSQDTLGKSGAPSQDVDS